MYRAAPRAVPFFFWTILRNGGIMTLFDRSILRLGGGTVKDKKLTFIEATMLVAGAGIGTGILTIPYAINQIGIWGTLTAVVAAYGVSVFLYLIIADLTLNSKESAGLLEILREHLLFGKHEKGLTAVSFVILTLLLLENLVVYIMCAADVLVALFEIDINLAKVVFYLLASLVIFFGIKGVGIGEKFSVALIGSVIAILTVLALAELKQLLTDKRAEWKNILKEELRDKEKELYKTANEEMDRDIALLQEEKKRQAESEVWKSK